MSETINVIGAGLAGSIVTRLLRKHGFTVRVFDDKDPLAGSRASSNLYIASWLKKFGSAEAARGIEVLESIIPAEHIDQPFSRGIADALKVKHVAQKHVLVEPDHVGVARKCELSAGVETHDHFYPGRTIMCVGARDLNVEILVGHCLLIPGRLPAGHSSLTMPLPYRHHKLYQFDENTIYFANSTALKRESFEKRRVSLQNDLVAQAAAALKITPGELQNRLLEYRIGYRPIIPDKPFGQLAELAPGVYSVNGGGKNGMVAYANLAAELLEKLKQ